MTESLRSSATEDELDILVSVAIRRAEVLAEEGDPGTPAAWREVRLYEELLSRITAPTTVEGGVARVGAVYAALAAGDRLDAEELAEKYRAEGLTDERRARLDTILTEDFTRRGRRYRYLWQTGRLAALDDWKNKSRTETTRVFPLAA
ncbi:MAG: hypothetical protein FJX77_14030 [Armatimonadetes bacterium]|nr:hypothetical protein [Armatimonadota bacterium]